MLAAIQSVAIRGIEGAMVSVELDIANGLPHFVIVGLPDGAVRESRERVVSAIRNSGFRFPSRRITVNLAPAQARKEGTHFDLPVALAALCASGQIPPGPWAQRCCFIGELALDGALRPVPGVLAMSLQAKACGFEGVVVPQANVYEARAAGLPAYGAASLRELSELLAGGRIPLSLEPKAAAARGAARAAPAAEDDLADVRGQELAKRALEIAAAGGHNLLLIGFPGVGKSMLARRLVSILPRPTEGEALEIARIRSIASRGACAVEPARRPFRAPHHTASAAALVGGGKAARPGEATLAHGGVLFLDEIAEFTRPALEALRQPLEDFTVTVSRASEVVSYPARFMLVAATNPCPCGFRGHAERACLCTPPAIERYLGRLSGPLVDRIDLQVEMSGLEFGHWSGEAGETRRTSSEVRAGVERARQAQRRRFSSEDFALNAYLPARDLRRHCELEPGGLRVLEAASKKRGLSARSLDRVLRVARTIADLEGRQRVSNENLMEAVSYRSLDRLSRATQEKI